MTVNSRNLFPLLGLEQANQQASKIAITKRQQSSRRSDVTKYFFSQDIFTNLTKNDQSFYGLFTYSIHINNKMFSVI